MLRPLSFIALLAAGALSCGFGTGPAADVTAPAVTITAPTDSSVSGTIPFTAQVLDDTGIANVIFSVDDRVLVEDPRPPFGTIWATNTIKNGIHRLSVTGVDITGKSTTVARNVTVANSPN